MKKNVLLLAILLSVTAGAKAQQSNSNDGALYKPSVIVLSTHETDSVYYHDGKIAEIVSRRRTAIERVTRDYEETHRHGFDQFHKPHLIFTTKDNRFAFALGGFVRMKGSYDFDGISDNPNFIPYLIAVPQNYNSRQKFNLNATGTRFFMKAITNTSSIGRIQLTVEMDFGGGAVNSYTPHMRSGYIALLGLTLGRDATTFCDLQSVPVTIDGQGPNCYNFNYTTLVRYEHQFLDRHLQAAVALEMPSLTATYNDNFAPLHQRMPDIPVYIQYAWGATRESHIRMSAILRNMYVRNLRTAHDTSLLGWGVQLSGRIRVCGPVTLFMNGVYGNGIASYIQDLATSGLDMLPDPRNGEHMQTLPMWGAQLSAQIALLPRLTLSGGYSTVSVQYHDGIPSEKSYRHGQYIFGNLFYAVNSRCKVATEFNFGSRKNENSQRGEAHRISMMIQYNF